MDRFEKGQEADGHPPKLVSRFRFIRQEVGRIAFALIEGCAYAAWHIWKLFHPKAKRHVKA